MIILDHIKMFENKIYKMNCGHITRNPRHITLDPRHFPLTLEISPSTLDKNLRSEIEISINQRTEQNKRSLESFILKLTFRRKF